MHLMHLRATDHPDYSTEITTCQRTAARRREALAGAAGLAAEQRSGVSRIRTGDPLLAKQVLYQLSYYPA
jgi:hypothetical protein